jgi:hypothetical protein
MANADPDAAQAGMDLWTNWMNRAGAALVDMGSPTERVAIVDPSGSVADPTGTFIGGFSVIEADSSEEAIGLVAGHPHLHAPGNPSVELLELLTLQGME